MDNDIKERIDMARTTKRIYEERLELTKDDEEREYIQNRIESCRRLIDHLYEKENPTKKKEMYK